MLDCAQLYEQFPAGGYVNFQFNGVHVNLLFSHIDLQCGLNGQASQRRLVACHQVSVGEWRY